MTQVPEIPRSRSAFANRSEAISGASATPGTGELNVAQASEGKLFLIWNAYIDSFKKLRGSNT